MGDLDPRAPRESEQCWGKTSGTLPRGQLVTFSSYRWGNQGTQKGEDLAQTKKTTCWQIHDVELGLLIPS